MKAPAVVLIGGTIAIKPLAEWYYRQMGLPVLPIPYAGVLTIERSFQKLAPRIEREYGKRPLIIVGHSQGGLVGVRYVEEHQDAKLVGLSIPIRGTQIAWVGLGLPAARDMLPGSDFLLGLQERLPNVSARMISIFLHHDYFIRPFHSSYAAGARNILFAERRVWPQLRAWREDIELREGRYNHINEVRASEVGEVIEEIRQAA